MNSFKIQALIVSVVLVSMMFLTQAQAQESTGGKSIDINVQVISLNTDILTELGLGNAITIDENDIVSFSPLQNGTDPGIGDISADGNIEVGLQALIDSGAFTALSNSVLNVPDGKPAVIYIGESDPNRSRVVPGTQPSVPNPMDPHYNGIQFSITPTILPDNLIQMECTSIISGEVTTVNGGTPTSTASINSQEMTSTGVVANGYPFLIRHQTDNANAMTTTSVSGTGGGPVLTEMQPEFILIVTPTIVE